MALNTKAIKRRIKSISSTKKITKAMEMISAVKMRRAVATVLSTRSYAKLAWEIVNDIAKKTHINSHPLLTHRQVKKVGMILITSNRGLAGGFTSRLMQTAQQYIKTAHIESNPGIEIILTGKHGRKSIHKLDQTVVAEFDKIDLTTRIEEVFPMTQLAIQEYTKGNYDRIVVAYTDFVSAISQVPKIKQILPLEKGLDDFLGTDDEDTVNVAEVETEEGVGQQQEDASEAGYYTFEPGARVVLDSILPRLVEMQIYQAILESDASEHSARMLTMRNASDAANDMIKELNYTFNKARQAAITQEISEIVGGAAALE
ncbi:MAG: ATP synthase F1 subunit gamma [Candidatus Magasanikbacteria bacterium]|nr:ATP synthase F1 subunit gamma [Candidatus Magasanikbacteria bacterium]